MSEGRQLVLLLLGGVVLAAVGVVAATVFPEPCEDVEGIGDLELAFVPAAAALAVEEGEATALEAIGEEIGIGPWRGAVTLPEGTRVLPSDFGFFAVTDSDLVALRPGSARASAPRDVSDVEVVGIAGTSAGLVTDDRRIAVVSSDYERERCGELPPDGEVLAVDRGFAALADDGGQTLRLWTLSGDDVRSVGLGDPVLAATIVDEYAVVATTRGAWVEPFRDDEPVDSVPLDAATPLDAVDGRLLVREAGRPGEVLVLAAAADGTLDTRVVAAPGEVVDAAVSPGGVVLVTPDAVAADDVVVTDPVSAASLPPGVVPTEVVVSEDGQVGVVVDGPVSPVLLVWGRDLPPAIAGG